jgi:hypothetical protein
MGQKDNLHFVYFYLFVHWLSHGKLWAIADLIGVLIQKDVELRMLVGQFYAMKSALKGPAVPQQLK